MMQRSCINLEQATVSQLEEIPANRNWFRNEFPQRVASQGTSIEADQQQLFPPVGRDEDRRNPTTQTARPAVAVNLPLTGIHHAQIALTVYDFAGEAYSSQVMSGLLVRGRAIQHGYRARCYFHHCSALAIDQLAL